MINSIQICPEDQTNRMIALYEREIVLSVRRELRALDAGKYAEWLDRRAETDVSEQRRQYYINIS